MKRVFILITITFLLTGCKVEYKLILNDKLFLEENITMTPTTDNDLEELKDFKLNIPINYELDDYDIYQNKSKGIKYYKKNKTNDSINFSYKYKNYFDYTKSTLSNLAYEYISVSKINDEELTLSSSKEFKLFEDYDTIEEVKITIETNFKVLSNNADEVNRHKYTWYLTKDNAYGKGIYLKVNPSKEDLNFFEKLRRGDYFNSFTVTIFIACIGAVIYLFLKKKSNNIDKI